MDTPTIVAVLAFAGAVITAALALYNSSLTNRSENKQSAETAAEKGLSEQLEAKDERLAYRDEVIADLRQKLADAEARVTDLVTRGYSLKDRLDEKMVELRVAEEERDRYKAAIDQMRAEEREKTNGYES